MRTLSIVLAALLFAPSALAQTYAIDKGSYLLGGGLSFTSQGGDLFVGGSDDDRIISISITPTLGYFVAPGLALGGDVQLQRASRSEFSSTSITIGPSLAYYFGQPTTRTYPFIEAGIGYTRISFDFDESDSGSTNGYQFGVSGGLSHMIARNVALTGALFYQNQTFSDDGESASGDTFGFQGGVTAFIF